MLKTMVFKLWQTIMGSATTGHVLTAGAGGPTFQAASGGGDTFVKAVLATDVTTDDTAVDITGFTFAIAASEVWEVFIQLQLNTLGVANSAEIYFTAPASTKSCGQMVTEVVGTALIAGANAPSAVASTGSGSEKTVTLSYIIRAGATPGTIQFKVRSDTVAEDVQILSIATNFAAATMVAHRISP